MPIHLKKHTKMPLDDRLERLNTWIAITLNSNEFDIHVASADASFRRYFRVFWKDKHFIAMDAPPNKENSESFVQIAGLLSSLDVHTPEIYAKDLAQGFLLLEDLGKNDYLDSLTDLDTADLLYKQAIEALLKLQTGLSDKVMPYSEKKLREEMALFPVWFLERHLQHNLSDEQQQIWSATQTLLCETCTEQPQVWVHRDFHSRNLMITETNTPGVIDFQDLVCGPIAYDLASIFKDCYIQWPRKQQLTWLQHYYQQLTAPPYSFAQLIHWYDLTGFQRHLKILGIFCRLNYRDGKSHYLSDLSLTAKYCLEVLDLYAEKIPAIYAFKQEFYQLIKRAL